MSTYIASHLKDMNRLAVYRLIGEKGTSSKSELSRLTGISGPTIIKIVNFLLEQELITEGGEGEAPLGRKPQILKNNPSHSYSIGVIYEGETMEVGIANLACEVIAHRKQRIAGGLTEALGTGLFACVDSMLEKQGIPLSKINGMGIGVPGIYDVENETILSAPLIGIEQPRSIAPLIREIEARYRLDVAVENDLNLEAWGEYCSLAKGGDSDLIYLSLGTGLGCGVVLEGRLRRGSRFLCGEVGYMAFDDSGLREEPQAGWLERRINLAALKERFGVGKDGALNPKDYKQVIDYLSTPVALCINNLAVCFDCENISLGGELFALLGEPLIEKVRQKVKGLAPGAPVLYHAVSRYPGITGAAHIAKDRAIRRILFEESRP